MELLLKAVHLSFLPLLVQVVVMEVLIQVVLEVLEDQVVVGILQVPQAAQAIHQRLHLLKVIMVEVLLLHLPVAVGVVVEVLVA